MKKASFVFAVFFIPFFLFAIGVSVTPSVLSLRVLSGKEAVTRFVVSNPSKEVGLFEAYSEEFEEYIKLVPSRFVLEAGEKREVVVRARMRGAEIIRTVIAVEAQPLGVREQGIGGGVRIPISVESLGSDNQLADLFANVFKDSLVFWSFMIVAVILSAFLLIWQRKDRP